MYKDLLPIGSVVLLKGGEKRVMIIGRLQAKAGDDKPYDYSACYYPEGLTGADSFFFFNRDAIACVFSLGYLSNEEMALRQNVLNKLGEVVVKDGQVVPKE